jgi:hypothetical protein
MSANYEYDPFGQVSRATGPVANENRFQFSTKRCDRTTDLQLYEYRARRTDLAWLSRDPIEELGVLANPSAPSEHPTHSANQLEVFGQASGLSMNSPNPYQFCFGDSISQWDLLGLVPDGRSFIRMYPDYKTYESRQVWTTVIGGTKGPMFANENSCAARVSAALNRIPGENITGPVEFTNEVPPRGIPGRFISNAKRMNGYLKAKWGTTSQCSKTQAYYFKSTAKKGEIERLRQEIYVILETCCYRIDFVAVVSTVVNNVPRLSGHVGAVTQSYDDGLTPFRDSPDVWLLPPTLE